MQESMEDTEAELQEMRGEIRKLKGEIARKDASIEALESQLYTACNTAEAKSVYLFISLWWRQALSYACISDWSAALFWSRVDWEGSLRSGSHALCVCACMCVGVYLSIMCERECISYLYWLILCYSQICRLHETTWLNKVQNIQQNKQLPWYYSLKQRASSQWPQETSLWTGAAEFIVHFRRSGL